MGKNKRMTMIIIAGVLLLTVIGVAFAYFAVSVINGTRQNLSATTVESVNLTLDDNDQASYSGQVSFGSTLTRNLKLTNEGGPTKVALYFQDLINTYTAGAFTYTLSYATTENGSYTSVLTDVAIPRRSKASSTAKIQEIEMPATTTRYYKITITYNNLPEVNQTRDLTAQFKTGFTIKSVPKTIAEAHPNGDYLKDFSSSYNTLLGNTNITRDRIFNIKFSNSKSAESGTVYATDGSPWDVSVGQNGSVMAWVTNTQFEDYYDTISECNDAITSGYLERCEEVETFTYYIRYRKSNNNVQGGYKTLAECENGMSALYACKSSEGTAIGYFIDEDCFDLYIGQDGGVIANPNISYLFYGYGLDSIDLNNLDTQYVTNMSHMFDNFNTYSIDLSSLDTTNVTNMSYMFSNISDLATLDISSLNTSNVTDMNYMFLRSLIQTINLTNLDTSSVTTMKGLFQELTKVSTLNLSSFDTSNVTDMENMFYKCGTYEMAALNLSNFDTASVTNMQGMFQDFHTMGLNLSSFDTANVTSMSYMFYSCSQVTSLDLSNFDTSNVTSMYNMFRGMLNLESLNILSFNTSKVEHFDSMFGQTRNLFVLDISSFDFSNNQTASGIYLMTATTPDKTIYVTQAQKDLLLSYSYNAIEGNYVVKGS